jgi:hypothetical protein
MSERWLTTDEAISAIQAHVAGSPGFASGLLKKARASGEVRWRNLDPVLLLADDGIVGMNLRHGAQRKHGVTADGEPVAYTFASSPGANGDKINEVDLLDWLTREKGPSRATPKAKGGRPRKYDVAAVEAEVMRLM